MKTGKCKGCGRKIIWAINEDGNRIPLDAVAPVYMVAEAFNGATGAVRSFVAYVSHFATCPNANDFSASNKKRKEKT